MNTAPDQSLKMLDRLVGSWVTEATHPAFPGVVVGGTVTVEWLEGGRFLIHRARTDHPDFPDAISIIGFMGHDRADGAAGSAPPGEGAAGLSMHYFDSRGVFRVYEVSIDETEWRWSRDAPGFSQRLTGTFADGDDVIVVRSKLCLDDLNWEDDLAITYRRRK